MFGKLQNYHRRRRSRNFILKNRIFYLETNLADGIYDRFAVFISISIDSGAGCGGNHRVPFVGFRLTHMWAVRTIPEVFCMFSIHFHAWMYSWSCWKIMQHLRLQTPPLPSRADYAQPLHVITFEKIISHHISGLISTRSRLSFSFRFAGDNSGEKFTSSLIKAYEIRASASAKTFHERRKYLPVGDMQIPRWNITVYHRSHNKV